MAAQHKEIHRLTVLSVSRGYWLGLFVKHGNGGANSNSLPYLRWVHNFWLARAHNYRVNIAKRAPVYSVLELHPRDRGRLDGVHPRRPVLRRPADERHLRGALGYDAVSRLGDAHHWPAGMQMAVGYRAVQALGFSPWSTSAAACGH